jgi:hypothetical protein
MGLDMYLHAETFTSKEYFNPKFYKQIVEDLPFTSTGSAIVKIEVAYWRKSNQIHHWFVQNVQSNEDDCRSYNVSRQQLEELLGLCKEVKADSSLAAYLLPSTDGFFFGSTEYDEYYFNDIDETIEQLERILKEVPKEWDFTYRSSW